MQQNEQGPVVELAFSKSRKALPETSFWDPRGRLEVGEEAARFLSRDLTCLPDSETWIDVVRLARAGLRR